MKYHSWTQLYIDIRPTEIYTRIYHKPTDQKYYLHYYSAHPRNQKNSVPYGLLIRCQKNMHRRTPFWTRSQKTKIQKISNYPARWCHTKSKKNGQIISSKTNTKEMLRKNQTNHQLQPHESQPSRDSKIIWRITADDKKISNHTRTNKNHLQ